MSPPDEGPWSQLPELTAGPTASVHARHRELRVALTVAAGPCVVAWVSSGVVAGVVAAACGGVVAGTLVHSPWWRTVDDRSGGGGEPAEPWSPGACVGLGSLALAAAFLGAGAVPAAWLALGVVGVLLAIRRPFEGGAAAPTLRSFAAASTSSVLVALVASPRAGLAVLAAALVALALAPSALIVGTDAVLRAAVHIGGSVIRSVVFGAVGLVVVILPWAVWWVTRWDPTWSPRAPGSRWTSRDRDRSDARRPWDPDPAAQSVGIGRRLHRLLVLSAWAVLVVIAAVGSILVIGQPHRDQPAAMTDAPWWSELSEATSAVHNNLVLNTTTAMELRDMRSPYLNVVDGARLSWVGPTGRCRPMTVWMLGGSAMFGEGQRDERTIASQVARLAHDDGLAVEVRNLAVPGDTLLLEARRLELRLLETGERPDLVTFYDGYNELAVRRMLNDHGLGDRRLAEGWIDASVYRVLDDVVRGARGPMDRLLVDDSIEVEPQARGPRLAPEEVARRALRQYEASREVAERVVGDRGLEAVWFYQPTLASRDSAVPGEPSFAAELDVAENWFREHLPPGTVDLSGALDAVRQPLYYDEVHTNERGAAEVARAMYTELEPRLRERCATRGPTECC